MARSKHYSPLKAAHTTFQLQMIPTMAQCERRDVKFGHCPSPMDKKKCSSQIINFRPLCLWKVFGTAPVADRTSGTTLTCPISHCSLTSHHHFRYLWILLYTVSVHTAVYRVSQEEWTKLRESVPYVKLYRYNPKHLLPKLNGYGDNGHRKVWASGVSTYCKPSVTPYSTTAHARQQETTSQHRNAVTLAR